MHDRLCQSNDRIKLGNADPKIPVIEAGKTIVQQAYLVQAGAPKYCAATGNEILAQEVPEHIALWKYQGINLSRFVGLVDANWARKSSGFSLLQSNS